MFSKAIAADLSVCMASVARDFVIREWEKSDEQVADRYNTEISISKGVDAVQRTPDLNSELEQKCLRKELADAVTPRDFKASKSVHSVLSSLGTVTDRCQLAGDQGLAIVSRRSAWKGIQSLHIICPDHVEHVNLVLM